MGDDDDAAEVVALEQRLLRPEIRAERSEVEALLHPDFQEFGASGRVWDRRSIIDSLEADPGSPGTAGSFAPVRLAEDVVLLTYRTGGETGSVRSSVWVRDRSSGWRLRFHQGTRVPGDPVRVGRP